LAITIRPDQAEPGAASGCSPHPAPLLPPEHWAARQRYPGYRRFEGLETAAALARLYAAMRLFVNFFQPSAEQALSQASLESMRYANSMSVIDQLGAIPAEPQAYVLACVCDRTPKSPNPDRALFV
jgi:hypothetical protein